MTQPSEAQPRDSSGGGLTQKIGPLPMWGWIAIAAAGGVVVLLWLQNRKAAQPTTQQPGADVQGADAATVANLQDQLATVESQIRNLQGGPSQPTPTTTDRKLYTFGIVGDPSPQTRYIGVPGIGYYGAPSADVLQHFFDLKHPIDLGQISQSDAQSRFGTSLPWAQLGQS